MNELVTLRLQGVRILAFVCWAATGIVLGGSLLAGSGIWPPVMALALAVFPTRAAMAGNNDEMTRIALGATLPLYPAIMLFQWAGAPWQTDLHMIFFAAIAIVAVLADWRPIVAAAAVTAVHHLLLNFVAPSLVFLGQGDIARVLLHAVIVVAETAVLVILANQLEALLVSQAEARLAKSLAEEAAERERAERQAEQQLVVDHIASGLRSMAAGDLSCTIRTVFPPAFDALRTDFNRTLDDLNAMIGSVANASRQIQAGTQELRNAADDLAHRTETQAATVESTSRTVSALAATAGQTAQQAQTVNGTLDASRGRAEQGHAVVAQAMETMGRIEKSAGEIAQIVSLIDGIAFQTNLLALNAGVEAARAGDAGKGFAVVASEVRALAQRSADAARDIKELITTSTTQVNEGVSQVTQTGKVLQEVMSEVVAIGAMVSEITTAAQGNAEELSGLGSTFTGIDRATQQNAAMVEESNAALRSLADETTALVKAISRFRAEQAAPGMRRAA